MRVDYRRLAREERSDLDSFLKELDPQDWEARSLCEGWRVRDVVAHLISFDELGFGRFFVRGVKARFSPDRVNAMVVAESAERRTSDLLAVLERHLDPRGPLSLLGCLPAFFDALVHHQDIRRPLGMPRPIPTERLVQGLRVAFISPSVRGRRRGRGLRLIATDIDWSRGDGPEVQGPAEAILMAVAGRRGAIEELSGPGRSILADRIKLESTLA